MLPREISFIARTFFESSVTECHGCSNRAPVAEVSLGTFTLGCMSTELGIKCSADLLTEQRRAGAPFQKTTTGANKENLFSGVNRNEPARGLMQRRYYRAHTQLGLAGSGCLRFTPLLTFVWPTVAMARGVCIFSTWGLSGKEGRDRMRVKQSCITSEAPQYLWNQRRPFLPAVPRYVKQNNSYCSLTLSLHLS